MSDLISRDDVYNVLKKVNIREMPIYVFDRLWNGIRDIPSAELQEFEWCTDCKEYDQEKHCCHRWTKVIGQTVEELKATERTKGRWIYDTERVAGDGWTYSQYHCSECGFQELGGLANFCPNCGARMER